MNARRPPLFVVLLTLTAAACGIFTQPSAPTLDGSWSGTLMINGQSEALSASIWSINGADNTYGQYTTPAGGGFVNVGAGPQQEYTLTLSPQNAGCVLTLDGQLNGSTLSGTLLGAASCSPQVSGTFSVTRQ